MYGKKRKVQNGANSSLKDKQPDPATVAAIPTEKEDHIIRENFNKAWTGPGTVPNYIPAWERKFQKSMQQKQARMNSLQQQSSLDNNKASVLLSARQENPASARGAGTSNILRQSHVVKSSQENKGDKATVSAKRGSTAGKIDHIISSDESAAMGRYKADVPDTSKFVIDFKDLNVSIENPLQKPTQVVKPEEEQAQADESNALDQ